METVLQFLFGFCLIFLSIALAHSWIVGPWKIRKGRQANLEREELHRRHRSKWQDKSHPSP